MITNTRNHLLWNSNKYYIFCVCVCVCLLTQVIQHVNRISYAPYCHLWLARLYHIFPHQRINEMIFGKVDGHKMFVFIFSATSYLTFRILRIVQRGISINVHRYSNKAPVILSDFHETWIFSTGFRKILKYQIPWKSVQWEPFCFIRTDGRTGYMMNLIVVFRSSVNAANRNEHILVVPFLVSLQCILILSFRLRVLRLTFSSQMLCMDLHPMTRPNSQPI